MLALVAMALVSQAPAPEVSVVLSQRATITPARAGKFLEQLETALRSGGVAILPRAETDARLKKLGFPDATFCAGKRQCLSELARQLPAAVVVGLSLVELRPDLAIHIEAAGADGAKLMQGDAAGPSSSVDAQPAFVSFASQLAACIRAQSKPADAPQVEAPKSVEPAPVVVAPAPEVVRPRWPSIVTGSLAGVALISVGILVGHAFFLQGIVKRGTMIGPGLLGSDVMGSQAMAINARANAELAAAIGCAVGAAALAVITFLIRPTGEPAS